MKCLLTALCLSMFCLYAGGCSFDRSQPAETRYVDRANLCSVVAADPWKRNEHAERSGLVTVLRLNYGEQRPALTPGFVVSVAEEGDRKVTVDEAARETIRQARETLSDQGNTATIETIKLDGEDARQFTFLKTDKTRTVRFLTVVVRHAGKLLFVQFFCDETQTAQMLPEGQKVLRSFKWNN